VKVNEVSIYKTIIKVCGDLYQSLAVYLTDMREHFDRFEKTTKDIGLLPDVDYKELKTRTKRRKTR